MSGVQKPAFSVIEFTSLPANMRTSEMRKKFDTDGSGFLESQNSNDGQNEIYRMEQAMGLDLSKYKKEASKVKTCIKDFGNINSDLRRESTLYDKNGRKSVVLTGNSENCLENVYRTVIKGNVETTNFYDTNFNQTANYECVSKVVTRNVTYKGIKGLTKTEWLYQDGSSCIRYEKGSLVSRESSEFADANYRTINIEKDKDGEIISYSDFGTDPKTVKYDKYYTDSIGNTKTFERWQLKKEELFSGKYGKLVKRTKTDDTNVNYKAEDCQDENGNYKGLKEQVQYLLNGKPAEVKLVDNGRYEITQDGKTEYYSHDGKKLRMDYVTAENKNLENGYKKKESLNGKTAWYYNSQGKDVSKAEYHSSVVKNIKVKNGKFIYKGKELEFKYNGNGTYTVKIDNEDFILKMKTN